MHMSLLGKCIWFLLITWNFLVSFSYLNDWKRLLLEFSRETETIRYIENMERKFYWEIGSKIVEVQESYDLPSAKWGLRENGRVVLIQSWRIKSRAKDIKGFPGDTVVKNMHQCRRCRKHGQDTWVGKIPWRRKWQQTPVFLPGESHGQRSLTGYSPWGNIESDVTGHKDIKSQVMKFWKPGALMFKGRGIWMSQLKHRERTCPSSAFLFYLGF